MIYILFKKHWGILLTSFILLLVINGLFYRTNHNRKKSKLKFYQFKIFEINWELIYI